MKAKPPIKIVCRFCPSSFEHSSDALAHEATCHAHEGDVKLEAVVHGVRVELERARSLHPPMPTMHHGLAVLHEEFMEVQELVYANERKLSRRGIEDRNSALREELLQTAAMCVRMILDLGLR